MQRIKPTLGERWLEACDYSQLLLICPAVLKYLATMRLKDATEA
jgi:hypothetical protein